MGHAHATEWLRGANEPGKTGRAWASGRRPGAPACLAPWLSPEQFQYAPVARGRAAVRLVGSLSDGDIRQIAGPSLVVRARLERTSHPAIASVVEERADSGLLWVVSFDLPLEIVQARRAVFTLSAVGRLPVALPSPLLDLSTDLVLQGVDASLITARRARRYLLAVGAGVAVATSGATASVAAAAAPAAAIKAPVTASSNTTRTSARKKPGSTKSHGDRSSTRHTHSSTPTKTNAHTPSQAHATSPAHGHRTTSLGSAIKITRHLSLPKNAIVCPPAHSVRAESEAAKAARHRGAKAGPKSDATATPVSSGATKHPWHRGARRCEPLTSQKQESGSAPRQQRKHKARRAKHHLNRGRVDHASGGAALLAPHVITRHLLKPHLAESSPRSVTTTSGTAVPPSSLTIWDGGFNIDPVTAAQLERFSTLGATLDQPPKLLIPIYKAAGKRFRIPWQILAAINAIETNYGQDLAVSPAGAIGWMQFMPGTWREFGMAADGTQAPNPFDPKDAVFSAARYLAASGGAKNIRRALFAYNHALWYVDAVLWRAQLISDAALGKRVRSDGYALPLDLRYMLDLGRTDDGVDIEDAPDGAAVYSMTPGIVTAVASDPTGFGPNYPVIMVTKGPLAGEYIYYGHVAASLVRVGQHVLAGQPIAVMGHTGDAASLGHGHIELGFSDASGDPLNHHAIEGTAWTPSGDAMRHVLTALTRVFSAAADARPAPPNARDRHSRVDRPSPIINLQALTPYGVALTLSTAVETRTA